MAVLFMSFKSWPARAVFIIYVALISAGAAVGFHWLSDVVAGIIIGALIGVSVSRR